ncbi:protein lin-52 homolog [Neocloeon triangulifer]|uniref:protein lin-52 homolog n=1 Tax=Neocloeon triangulifer TaxID=2078957 RepID=UPI00286F00E1|nr:protein lin-52 homolog [Neocloeon triangulifer]
MASGGNNATNSEPEYEEVTERYDDDFDDLFSLETMDRASPELWPQRINGLTDLASLGNEAGVPPWEAPLNPEDISMLHHFSTLTLSALIVEVRKLYDKAYQLGLDESKEMTRGKYLNILNRRRKPESN